MAAMVMPLWAKQMEAQPQEASSLRYASAFVETAEISSDLFVTSCH
jgi:hypothetical protein